MQCQGAKTFEMRTLECITCDLWCSVMEAEKKILVQECEDRKKKPKDVLSIVQQIKQEDTVGAISPKITNPAFIDKDKESVVEVVLSPKERQKQKRQQLVTMTNAMQSFIENEETNNENPQYTFVQDGVDEELDKETGVSVVDKDGKGAAQVLLEADGLGLPNELDDDFGFGEVGEEDDDNSDEDIDDDQSMICALMKEIADIESGSGEELSDGDKKAASKLGAKKKLVMSQKDLHGESVPTSIGKRMKRTRKSLKLKITILRKNKRGMMTMTMTLEKMKKMRRLKRTACIRIRADLLLRVVCHHQKERRIRRDAQRTS